MWVEFGESVGFVVVVLVIVVVIIDDENASIHAFAHDGFYVAVVPAAVVFGVALGGAVQDPV